MPWQVCASRIRNEKETPMKLYYSPGACSLSPHIALAEAGLSVDYVKVNLREKKTDAGDDYLKVNPKGQVPVLGLDGGGVLTEGPAIVQYIADKAPNAKLAPANGSNERYQLQEWLNLITSELHKSFSPLFNPTMPEEAKNIFRERISKNLAYINGQLAGKDYLMGSQFSVADGYLFTILRWAIGQKFDLAQHQNLKAYFDRVGARPKVKEAMLAEGLIKAA
jgi:glutathione S-transferase